MILGMEFCLMTDENGKRWFRLAPVLKEGTASDLRFFSAIFVVVVLTALAVWGMVATDVAPTTTHVNLSTGRAEYGFSK